LATNFKALVARHKACHCGSCFDNAHTESFWARLKTELLNDGVANLSEAHLAINHYLAYCNAERRYSALGYLTPNQFKTLSKLQLYTD